MPEQNKFSKAVYRHISIETSLLSNTFKVCVNEIDNTQEKDYLENFVLI